MRSCYLGLIFSFLALPIDRPALAQAFPSASDPQLQAELLHHLDVRSLQLIRRGELSVTLVDITDLDKPRLAHFNGDAMFYAASLPKIAIMLGVFEQIEKGEMRLDETTRRELEAMIRYSSNEAATALYDKVGVENLISTLEDERYRFYDPEHGGGLWVGKPYSPVPATHRDPLKHLSHGATGLQVARFFYLLESDQLVAAEYCPIMKDLLARPGIAHKFVKGLQNVEPQARIYRKSGTWRDYHADGALIERPDGRKYIAVALCHASDGGRLLEKLIVAMNNVIDTL